MRKYEVIWEKLKKSEEGQWVEVKVAMADRIQTIINMVQVEKSRANVSRKHLDLPQFGKLEIKREPDHLKVSFRLKNSGAGL